MLRQKNGFVSQTYFQSRKYNFLFAKEDLIHKVTFFDRIDWCLNAQSTHVNILEVVGEIIHCEISFRFFQNQFFFILQIRHFLQPLFFTFPTRKIYDYCIWVLLCLRHNIRTHIYTFVWNIFHSSSRIFHFLRFFFQISISFMSQKCQNLLPLKINSSQSKGIGFCVWRRVGKNRSIFRFICTHIERKKHQQWTRSDEEGSFLAPRKFWTLCRFFMWLQFAASFPR